MTIYWALPIFAVVFYWLCKMTAKNGHRHMQIQIQNSDIKAYFIIMSLFMIVIIGLRSENVGIDSSNYYNMYKDMSREDFSYIFEPDVNDRGYFFLTILTNRLGLNFYAFNIIYAVFNVGVISYLIYEYSDMPWLSYLLYIFFDFFILELTMVRQTLAMSIVILAVLKDKNETLWDFIKFAIIVLCASTIHTS
ncbi:MAG: EpsG family protein, partial [Clostridia bacterium]|nr:EpsG family protein [Clostridia bacterium]